MSAMMDLSTSETLLDFYKRLLYTLLTMTTLILPAKPVTEYVCSAFHEGEQLTHRCFAQSHEVARRVALTIWGIDPDEVGRFLSVATSTER